MTNQPEIAQIAARLTKTPRKLQWVKQIADAGPGGLDNTPIPWTHIAWLRREGLSHPVFRFPFYYEKATLKCLAVRQHLEGK